MCMNFRRNWILPGMRDFFFLVEIRAHSVSIGLYIGGRLDRVIFRDIERIVACAFIFLASLKGDAVRIFLINIFRSSKCFTDFSIDKTWLIKKSWKIFGFLNISENRNSTVNESLSCFLNRWNDLSKNIKELYFVY